jgi:signal peptidase II
MGSADNTENGGGLRGDVGVQPTPLIRPRLVAAIVASIVVADQITKLVAVDFLGAPYLPHSVVGNTVRLTLVYNPGAAFGLHLGPYSRWIFTALTIGALALLWRLYRDTRANETWRVFAIAFVTGGAIGNLIDRLRSSRGVVDFLDVGIGTSRWPTFNVADIAVSCGAVLLAIVLWREDATRQAASGSPDVADPTHPSTATDPANSAPAADAPIRG